MFTGIIEEIGTIENVVFQKSKNQLSILANKILERIQLGDSLSVNGVCLTVCKIHKNSVTVDIMPETFSKTNLKSIEKGIEVNLERALTLNTRLGGHLVTGHIDGLGKITHINKDENAIWIKISTDINILKYVIMKGSITVDGTSLTISKLDDLSFSVSLIPHSAENTTLSTKIIGDFVNLECDIIGKYVDRLLNFQNISSVKSNSISENFLKENGFM